MSNSQLESDQTPDIYVTVRAEDLFNAMVGSASAYGSSAKRDGKFILSWFGRLAAALEASGFVAKP